ncbi:MAG: DUF2130 domain-containing protein [Flavobacteriales bacterium]|nr:DUF2130 domain-containing protein [Flavobacteriales bacterium]
MKTPNLKITCPACRENFSPSDSIWAELKSSIEHELNEEIINQQKELEKKKGEYQRLQFKLSKERADLDKLIKEKVASGLLIEEKNLRRKIQEEINLKKEAELDLLNKQLVSKTKEISGLNKLKRKMAIEAEEKEAKLSVQTKFEETHKLEVLQKEQVINNLKEQLDLAKKKVDSYSSSGQLVGESSELFLENQIRENFSQDCIVKEVPKGIRGCDTIIEIMIGSSCIGKIAIEVKTVQSFSKSWIDKLKSDAGLIGGAQCLLLISKTMPKAAEGKNFIIIDNVFICNMSSAIQTIAILKYFILKINQVTMTHKDRETKQSMLFEFMTSVEFASIYEQVLTQFDSLRASHDLEKKRMLKLWSEREKMLTIALNSTIELYGKLRGITTDIIAVKSLEHLSKAS